jgi:hypothetical protein
VSTRGTKLYQRNGAKKKENDATNANKNGVTPVFIASQNGHTETVRALVQEWLPKTMAPLPSSTLLEMAA